MSWSWDGLMVVVVTFARLGHGIALLLMFEKVVREFLGLITPRFIGHGNVLLLLLLLYQKHFKIWNFLGKF